MLLDLLKDIAERSEGLTREDAQRLCDSIPPSWYTQECGYGRTSSPEFAKTLRELFPAFNWRIILDRTGERTQWRLTVDDNDHREHYFICLGGECIHCGKTARELSLGEEEVDEGGAIASILETAKCETKAVRQAERAGETISPETLEMRLKW